MSIDQAGTFLAGSILLSLGIIVLILAIVVINNVLHKYWKPVNIFTPDSWKAFNPPHAQFASQGELERIAPKLEPQQELKK